LWPKHIGAIIITNITLCNTLIKLKYLRTEVGNPEGEEQLGRHRCKWVERGGLDLSGTA
jgi:hypothetical protein